jgi:hypothetical protein
VDYVGASYENIVTIMAIHTHKSLAPANTSGVRISVEEMIAKGLYGPDYNYLRRGNPYHGVPNSSCYHEVCRTCKRKT